MPFQVFCKAMTLVAHADPTSVSTFRAVQFGVPIQQETRLNYVYYHLTCSITYAITENVIQLNKNDG